MLILKTSFKNMLGAGKRIWLNVSVLSFTFVTMVAYNGIIDGWQQEARRDMEKWETGAGQIRHPQYDPLDVFTLQDAHASVPSALQPHIEQQTLTPVLVTQAVSYPQGRMQNVILKGIDPKQTIVAIPSSQLLPADGLKALVGTRMAKTAGLKTGDRVMIRWRDRNSAFDAREALIAGVFETKVPSVDAGQLWLDLNTLRQMTGMPDEATYFIESPACPVKEDVDGWQYKNLKFLLADIDRLIEKERVESAVIYVFLLAIALLAVFDTQTLSVFRRQREIGTYIALGMTPRRVTALFTLEGTCLSLLAVLVGFVWGTPLLAWFAQVGMPMPGFAADSNTVIGDALYPAYELSSVVTSMILIICLSALISYLPARKIAKQSIVNALKGKRI
ncbi:MAG: FtsX-like permease family protein [Tannerella sp.]|jgi:ABC-type lipoprotein release transport system permease subunit|nr:FtsX-like permease family protein [Tannerella sp.]